MIPSSTGPREGLIVAKNIPFLAGTAFSLVGDKA